MMVVETMEMVVVQHAKLNQDGSEIQEAQPIEILFEAMEFPMLESTVMMAT